MTSPKTKGKIMNSKPALRTLALAALLLAAGHSQLSTAHAQGTAFTYQGQLQNGTNVANGSYSFAFSLYNTNTGGSLIGTPVTNNAVGVTNGLFTTLVDFGANAFTGASNWLQIAVATNGSGTFTNLTPRQQVTPAPYAVYAESANATNLVGAVPAVNVSGVALLSGENTFSGTQNINDSTDNNVLNLSDTRTGTVGSGAQIALSDAYSGSSESALIGSIGNGGGFMWRNGALELRPVARVNIYKGSDVTSASQVALTVIGSSGNVGIGTSSPAATLEVNGNAQIDGTVTATGFTGNGANVTNVNAAALGGISGAGFWTTNGNAGANPTNGAYLGTADNLPLEFHVNGVRGLRLEPTQYPDQVNVIGGSSYNTVSAEVYGATIGGGGGDNGFLNQVTGTLGTVSGGSHNTAGSDATVGGGQGNTASGLWATVAGGGFNTASGRYSFAGGNEGQATNDGAFVWADSQGGNFSSTNDDSFNVLVRGGARFVTGGAGMSVDGNMTIAGVTNYNTGLKLTGSTTNGTGLAIQNTASGGHKFDLISGGASSAEGAGAFELYDETAGGFRITVTPSGNVGISNTSPGHLLVVGSAGSPAYCDGATWENGSDRNSKEGFAAIHPLQVLEKVSALPISEWKYKAEADGTRHLGPVAQDFHAAFGLNGADDKHIATVDEEGVALAAIQGLNQKLNEKDAQIADLKTRLEKLEHLMAQKTGGAK